jgi:Holliday junction resolvase RusA-like endonuclease
MIEVKTAGLHFTIKLTPVSKKNSQQILTNPKTGRPFIMPSKKFKQYEKDAMWFIPKGEVIDFPVNVKCLFYMPTKRKCDLVNMQEAILDVMVKVGLLADDNYSIVQSMDGSRVLYDKENPRTEIYITEVKNNDKAEA